MKLICFVIFVVILAANTSAEEDEENEPEQEYAAKIIAECKALEELADVDTTGFWKGRTAEEMSFTNCFYEKAGLIVNGTFSLENAIARAEKTFPLDEASRAATIKALQVCGDMVKNDKEKSWTGIRLHRCLVKYESYEDADAVDPEGDKFIAECEASEVGSTDDDAYEFTHGGDPTSRGGQCLIGCYYEKTGVLVNGSISLENAIALTLVDYKAAKAKTSAVLPKYSSCLQKLTQEREENELKKYVAGPMLTACVVENCFAGCMQERSGLILKGMTSLFHAEELAAKEYADMTRAFKICEKLLKNETEKCATGHLLRDCLSDNV